MDQYLDTKNLESRRNLWDYGQNKVKFTEWIFNHLNIKDGDHIIELGSGTGKLWVENSFSIPANTHITLSDNSMNMVKVSKKI